VEKDAELPHWLQSFAPVGNRILKFAQIDTDREFALTMADSVPTGFQG
jgi:hypothetical protein